MSDWLTYYNPKEYDKETPVYCFLCDDPAPTIYYCSICGRPICPSCVCRNNKGMSCPKCPGAFILL